MRVRWWCWCWCWWWCAVSAVTSLRCPGGCSCGVGDELELQCGHLGVRAQLGSYLNIDCEGGNLTCAGLPQLQVVADNRTLPSVALRSCQLQGSLRCLLRAAGAGAVDVLNVKQCSAITDEFIGDGAGLKSLLVYDSETTGSVPTSLLSSLPSLRQLRVSEAGSELQLQSDGFPSLPALKLLELSADGVRDLPPGAFALLHNLTVLALWGNQIRTVQPGAFRGLSSLLELDLSDNPLSELPSDLFSDTPRLLRLRLQNVNLTRLRGGVLDNLHQLEKLSVSSLSLTSLPELGGLARLQSLDLSDSSIVQLPARGFAGLTALRELRVDRNQIQALPEHLFPGLTKLQSVSFQHNNISFVSESAFQGLPALRHLSLAYNKLTLLPPTTSLDSPLYYNLELQSPFRALDRLQSLDLSHNYIQDIFHDWRVVMNRYLDKLDLSYNRIQQLTSVDVQFLSPHVVVDLRHNNISVVNLNDVPVDAHAHADADADAGSTARILLDDNPIVCDCTLYTASLLLHGARLLVPTPRLDVGRATCAGPGSPPGSVLGSLGSPGPLGLPESPGTLGSPGSLRGARVADLDPAALYCDVTDPCPHRCSCLLHPATTRLRLVCEQPPPPDAPLALDEYGLTYTSLQLLNPVTVLHLASHVRELNLSRLNLTDIPELPSTLDSVDLTHNLLTVVPKYNESSPRLLLANNPLHCNCDAEESLKRLMKYAGRIKDFDNVTCADGLSVRQVDVARVCATRRALLLGGSLAMLGLLLAIAACLLQQYWLQLRVILLGNGWCSRLLPDKLRDRDKTYDVFISFAHGDADFVQRDLLPKLEPQYRCCVHYRDWVVGDMIPAQIDRSVKESRRTIVVLSKNFLKSIWGRLEFRAAHVQALRDGRARVVVVLLEDVSNDETLDEELRAYLSTNTYVRRDDPWFWNKLRYCLPRGGRDKRDLALYCGNGTAPGTGLHVQLNHEGQLVNATIKA